MNPFDRRRKILEMDAFHRSETVRLENERLARNTWTALTLVAGAQMALRHRHDARIGVLNACKANQ